MREIAGINERAPVVGAGEIEIAAPPEAVWDVLTDFADWPRWNPDVRSMAADGPVREGSVFRWKAGPGTVTSTVVRVQSPELIAWTGTTLGVRAIHFWWLDRRDGQTHVRTAESFEGLVARLLRPSLQKTLDRALEHSLRHLERAVRERALGLA